MVYELARECQTIAGRLIADAKMPFEHVHGSRVAWVFSPVGLTLHGARAAAFIGGGTVQGPHKDFFAWALGRLTDELWDGLPHDFLVMVDRTLYERSSPEARERLVFHELKHLQPALNQYGVPIYRDDGSLKLKTVPHDTEVFDDEVRRYGVEICGLQTHAQALDESRRKRKSRVA